MPSPVPAVRTASAVFIDVPNVATNTRNWKDTFKWERLSQAIAASEVLRDTDLILANAYVTASRDTDPLTNWAKTAFQTFGRSSFAMKVRWIDDIDSLIIKDMWQSVAERSEEILAEYGPNQPFRMRFILVTGDSDYVRSIDKLRTTYGERLQLEIYVYSWNNSLSEVLRARAVRSVSLESVPGFTRKIPISKCA